MPSSVTRDSTACMDRSGPMSCGATSTCQASRLASASRAITAKTSPASPNPASVSVSTTAATALASRTPSHARMTAASAGVSGTGGVSVPSTPTNGIRRGTSQGRSAVACSAMIARTAQPSR